ncbi:hypothetical protein HELRODRAFT_167450 [Helobdella robusta]|uniref:VWFA domain-containing protein n=1 Tax=Helobdella robusta TaxID=6412 RepID=T1EZE2_HELRO|nr:hypothetical protein HELRODRAFT_167450 [Helobdella robusta]ESO10937.1 hypothetical protein HELRODRAFT_167450 [Helobdella robusta]
MNNGLCSQACVDTYDSYYCTCDPGFDLEFIAMSTQQANCPRSAQLSTIASDVVFIVDSSYNVCLSSVTCSLYTRELQFVNRIIDSLNVNNNQKTRVGLITYASNANNRFFLNAYSDITSLKNGILNTGFQGTQGTNLAEAIRNARTNFFIEQNGDRGGVQNFIIILSNSFQAPSDVTSAANEVITAYQQGIITLAASVSQRVSDANLISLASYPLAPNPSYFKIPDPPTPFDSVAALMANQVLRSSALSTCDGKVYDIVFLIDGYQSNWNNFRTYLARFVRGLDIRSSASRVAVVIYTDQARQAIGLNQYPDDKNGLLNAILNLQAPANFASSSNAVSAFDFARTQVFTNQNGDRSDVENIVIFYAFNQYTSSLLSLQTAALQIQKSSGAYVYAYTSTFSNLNKMDLKYVSSHPHLEYKQFGAMDWDSTSAFDNVVLSDLCKPYYDYFCRWTAGGGFQCFCPLNDCDTVPLNGTKCIDVNECSNNNGGCQQLCSNTFGSFSCSCSTGYRLSSDKMSCEDVNECLSAPCLGNTICVNSFGSFYCLNRDSLSSGNAALEAPYQSGDPTSGAGGSGSTTAGMSNTSAVALTASISSVLASTLVLILAFFSRMAYRRHKRQMRATKRGQMPSSMFENYGASMKDTSSLGSIRSRNFNADRDVDSVDG